MSNTDFSLAYCTIIWTHHQAPICSELATMMGVGRFKMCLLEPVHQERKSLGWAELPPDVQWIIGPPMSRSDSISMRNAIMAADVSVLGAFPLEVMLERAKTGRLTFIQDERWLKRGFFHLRMLNPRFARGIRRLRELCNYPNVHYLAIGQYAAIDAKVMGLFGSRVWRWAYFVQEGKNAPKERQSPHVRIFWAGRFISWKRADTILRAIQSLGSPSDGFRVDLVGTGPTRPAMQRLAKRLGVNNCVRFHDSISHDEVRKQMAESDIFLLPSNRREGWGAVVSEAMSEGCVVVANKAAGVSQVLIDHGRTGYLFSDGDYRQLAGILRELIQDAEQRRRVGQSAAEEMRHVWHPQIAAQRLIELSQGLQGLAPMPSYPNGPCCHITV